MKRITAATLCFLILTVALPLCGAPQSGQAGTTKLIPKWFWGCWVVKRELPVPTAVVGVSEAKGRSIIGTRMVFTPTWVRSGRAIANPASYSVAVLSSRDFLMQHHGSASEITLRQIGIRSGQVTEVQVAPPEGLSDLDFVASDCYLRESKKDIVIDVEEDTFVAEKAKAGDPACASRSTDAAPKHRTRNP